DLLQCHHAGSLLSRLLSLSSSLLLDGFIWIESIGEYLVNVAFFLLPLLPVLIEPAECFSGHVRVVSGSLDHPFLQHGDPFPDGDGFLLHDHHLLPFAFFNHHYTDQYPDNRPLFSQKIPGLSDREIYIIIIYIFFSFIFFSFRRDSVQNRS